MVQLPYWHVIPALHQDPKTTLLQHLPRLLTDASDKGLELIGASDCTTCHRLHKEAAGASIGPSYSEVAAKYAPAADTTVDRLVHKIIAGGTGVWGAVPMTPHPALAPADVKVMVTYILSLKK